MESLLAADTASPHTAPGQLEPPAAVGGPSPYDQVPYSVGAFPQTSPDRLATLATLFGMRPTPPPRSRVLELGCASGGNLIPMALGWPQSQFVGIDLSARQIADGNAVAAELHLPNLSLRHVSILDVGDEWGLFDYILCHGVYSWVPPEVQAGIFRVCKRNLAPQGIAYISYNCLPGWHARGAIREMLWYHTQRITDPLQRVRAARGLLVFLARSAAANKDTAYAALMRQELAVLLRTPDTYLLHEHLEEHNEPLYFHQFVHRAADQGLQYLGEAQITSMVAARFGAEAEETLRKVSPDLLHMEQYMDFLCNRMFRQTLLCHAEVPLNHALESGSVASLRVASAAKPSSPGIDLRSDAPAEFRLSGSAILTTTNLRMKSAMCCLADRWPHSIPFGELFSAATDRLGQALPPEDGGQSERQEEQKRELAVRLLHCFLSGVVEFFTSPPTFISEVRPKPVASPYARIRARENDSVTNMMLQSVRLGEVPRIILRHLDGEHTADEIADILAQTLQRAPEPMTPQAARERAEQYVRKFLPEFARLALLVG